MKIFAFYLPQFHETEINNKWWGKGFTEWTNVKSAKPFFEGHLQPQIPLNNNYYNLLNSDTFIWQSELMQQYKIDGLAFYHYYSKGNLLLERPVEILMQNRKINIPFMFCWANHDWGKLIKDKFHVFFKQEYGNQNDWENHFQYLLPFFKDPRYEKKDNKPVFMLFNVHFKEKNKMLRYFDKRCKEEGFNGIYSIETFTGRRGKIGVLKAIITKSSVSEKVFVRQPDAGKRYFERKIEKEKNRVQIFDGDDIYNTILKNLMVNKKVLNGVFFRWDNTPRHREKGYVINPVSHSKFIEYYKKIKNEDFIFVNAWNEWAEGMMLEPTEQNKYTYLEWLKKCRNI